MNLGPLSIFSFARWHDTRFVYRRQWIALKRKMLSFWLSFCNFLQCHKSTNHGFQHTFCPVLNSGSRTMSKSPRQLKSASHHLLTKFVLPWICSHNPRFPFRFAIYLLKVTFLLLLNNFYIKILLFKLPCNGRSFSLDFLIFLHY